jgi:hypothetical protein
VQSHPSAPRAPAAVSGQLLELLTSLEQALIAETDALRARDVDALGRAVETKRRTLGLLAAIWPPGNDGGGSAAVVELLGRCRALNDMAGSAIAVLRRDVDQALGLLGIECEAPGYGSPCRPRRKSRALAVC